MGSSEENDIDLRTDIQDCFGQDTVEVPWPPEENLEVPEPNHGTVMIYDDEYCPIRRGPPFFGTEIWIGGELIKN